MTKPSVAICLLFIALLASAGCGGPDTPTEPPQTEIAPPRHPVVTEQSRETVEPQEIGDAEPTPAEPEDDPVDPAGAPATAWETVESPPEEGMIEAASVAEPNAPDPSSPSSEKQTTEIARPEGSGPAEPNQAEIPQPAEPEPNQPRPPAPVEDAAEAETEPAESPAEASEPGALDSFYRAYAQVLQDYVLEDGRVDYGGLRRKRLRLKQLLGEPDELDPNAYQKWPEDEKLAFWINTYNLKMLEILARNYPIQSSWWLRLTWPPSDIRHIGGIWSDYRFIVMDEEFTLGEVERRILRRTFGDPRAYLAITYGSRSGPRPRRTPYRGDRLDEQLDEQVRAFLASGKGFRIDRDERVVYLSALFKPTWRGKDFVGRYAMQKKFKGRPAETRAVLNFLTQYVSPDDVYFLEVENYTIVYMNFDWRIDDSAQGN